MISFGEKNTTTDQNGIFKIDDATVIQNRAYVKVFKEGYFHGSRNFVAFPNQRSFVKIVLLEKQILGNVSPMGGKIEMSNGVKLHFPPNAIAQADGTIYTGIVDVAVQYLDPMASDIFEIMPGNLRGIPAPFDDHNKGHPHRKRYRYFREDGKEKPCSSRRVGNDIRCRFVQTS